MIDRPIRRDSTYVAPRQVFCYRYTMVNHSSTHVNGRDFAKLICLEVAEELRYDSASAFSAKTEYRSV